MTRPHQAAQLHSSNPESKTYDAGYPGFDGPVLADLSKLVCSDYLATDLEAAIDSLNNINDDGYQFDNCYGSGPTAA